MKEKMKSHDRKKAGPGKSGRGLRSSDGRKNEAPDDTLTLQFVHGYIRCTYVVCTAGVIVVIRVYVLLNPM